MAERKGPGGEPAGRDPVESGQQEDHTHVAGERDDAVPVDAAKGEGTDLIDNHRDSGSAESGTRAESDSVEPEEDPRLGEDATSPELSADENVHGAAVDSELSDAEPSKPEPPGDGGDAAGGNDTSDIDTSGIDVVSSGFTGAETGPSSVGSSGKAFFGAQEASDEPVSPDRLVSPDGHGSPDGDLAWSAEVLNFRSSGNVVLDDTRQAAAEGVVDLEEIGDDPVDLSELLADDALLDVLGGTDPDIGSRTSGDEGSDLESMLVAWRQDVDAAPIADLVDVDMAAAAITEGSRPRRRLKRRHLVPVASAAAVLMIAFTGFGLAARDAQPGDALWGVAQVLYIDHARAAQARESAEGDLQFAAGAWEQGNHSAAEAALKRAREQMEAVDAEHGLDELEAAHASLTAKFDKREDTTESSTTEESASSEDSVTSTPPPPPQPPLPPEPPDTTSSQPPSSSTEPSESTTSPSETSGSSESPSSGAWGSENPFLPE